MELSTAKGTNDILPEEKIARDEMLSKIKTVFELYGYSPLETPAIERYDILASKYAGGAEILKETFKFKDQGDRDLGLRYDLTVPFSRVVGMNPNLKMPFKRYQIDKVWRDGPIGLGRYREFVQCDVDIVGCKSVIAESELMAIAQEVLKRLNLKGFIRANNRKLLNGLVREFAKTEKVEETILSIDKLEKIGREGVKKELAEKGIIVSDELFKALEEKNLEKLKKKLKDPESLEGIKELEDFFSFAKSFGANIVQFDPSLARGLAYYTGTIFEILLQEGSIKSSVGGGGRYDKMIGNFLESKQEYPAVGISFGLDRLFDSLNSLKRIEVKKRVARVFVIPIKELNKSIEFIQLLRTNGIKSDIDLMERGISKNLDFANTLEIPFVAFLGPEEVKKESVKIRNMKTGKEEVVKWKDAVKSLVEKK